MQSKTFTGKDKFDLDQQIRNWQLANPHVAVKKIYPAEKLPIEITKSAASLAKKEAQNTFSIRVDYEDSN